MTKSHGGPNNSPTSRTTFKPHLNMETCKPMKTARYRAVVREFDHAERVMEKKHRVEVLRALLEMHQQQHEPDDEYIKGLRQRLKGAQKQLENMRPF
jgi:hypothetical protein